MNAEPNEGQARLWNGIGGQAWVELADVLDHTLKPFEELLVDSVTAGPPAQRRRVLDVGCGTGATTLALAARSAADHLCTGLDISEQMITLARTRAQAQQVTAKFIVGDAQSFPFPANSFDTLISRFGVMFFDDPVAAFTNLRRAGHTGSRLVFVCWRGPEENPFMSTAQRVAEPLLQSFSPQVVGQPGPGAFADPSRVEHILERSGWTGSTITAVDAACTMPESDLVPYLTQMGPVGRALTTVDGDTRDRTIAALAEEYAHFIVDGQVRYTAACWMVNATAH